MAWPGCWLTPEKRKAFKKFQDKRYNKLNHSFLDRYSERDSPVHRLNARTKFVFTLLFILSVVLTPPDSWWVYGLCLAVITGLVIISRLPTGYVLKQSLTIIPFVLVIALFAPFFKAGEAVISLNIGAWHINMTDTGIQVFVNILIRAWLSILCLVWLSSTTRLISLLQGLEQMHFPHLMVMIMSFMYRYIFVIVDETMRMKQAWDSRNISGSRLHQWRTVGHMIGTLFVRSYERGERVYIAMTARGYDGQSRTLNNLSFKKPDAAFGVCLGLFLIAISAINLLRIL
jgi:cobalt/nickel transport system permease protein